MAKFREISYFLKQHDSSCGRHVIAMSRTEIKRRLSWNQEPIRSENLYEY